MSDYILIIEDDPYFSEVLKSIINDKLPNVGVVTINKLSLFVSVLPVLKSFPPVAILLDLMISIVDLKEQYPEIKYSDLEGGLSCIKLLNEFELTSMVPIIIISAREISMINKEIEKFSQIVSYITKPIDEADVERIIEIIHSSLSLHGNAKKRRSENTFEKIFSAIEAKPGVLGFKVDLKKLGIVK